jgi:thiamine biosynthesis protein ThiC
VKGNENNQQVAGVFVHQWILSDVMTAEFVSDRSHTQCSQGGGLVLFWMCMHQLRTRVVTQTIFSMRN